MSLSLWHRSRRVGWPFIEIPMGRPIFFFPFVCFLMVLIFYNILPVDLNRVLEIVSFLSGQ